MDLGAFHLGCKSLGFLRGQVDSYGSPEVFGAVELGGLRGCLRSAEGDEADASRLSAPGGDADVRDLPAVLEEPREVFLGGLVGDSADEHLGLLRGLGLLGELRGGLGGTFQGGLWGRQFLYWGLGWGICSTLFRKGHLLRTTTGVGG